MKLEDLMEFRTGRSWGYYQKGEGPYSSE